MKPELQPQYVFLTNEINKLTADLAFAQSELAAINDRYSAAEASYNSWVAHRNSRGSDDSDPGNTASKISYYASQMSSIGIERTNQEKKVADIANDLDYNIAQRELFVYTFEQSILNGASEKEAADAARAEADALVPPVVPDSFVWEWYHYAGIALGVVLLAFGIWKLTKKR